jgi:hypothetical protein
MEAKNPYDETNQCIVPGVLRRFASQNDMIIMYGGLSALLMASVGAASTIRKDFGARKLCLRSFDRACP